MHAATHLPSQGRHVLRLQHEHATLDSHVLDHNLRNGHEGCALQSVQHRATSPEGHMEGVKMAMASTARLSSKAGCKRVVGCAHLSTGRAIPRKSWDGVELNAADALVACWQVWAETSCTKLQG